MNNKQRKQWNKMVDEILSPNLDADLEINFEAIVEANAYILKLERELQALKHKKAVAAILQKKV